MRRMYTRGHATQRAARSVPTLDAAKALVQHFTILGLKGLDVGGTLRESSAAHRAPGTMRATPTIREALPVFLDHAVQIGELRQSTANAYRARLAKWAYPTIGDLPWNQVTREQIGAVLHAVKAAKKSTAVLEQIRCPLTRFYQYEINANKYPGVNPAADLKFFLGKQRSKRGRKRDLQWFRKDEARTLLDAARELQPRWYPFLMVCFGGGLRWGEATGLYSTDLDVRRGRLHVQRTWSEDGSRFEDCKDGESRHVKLPPVALAALVAHLEAMSIEADVKGWSAEQKKLVFPNSVGRVTRYGTFMEHVWQPLVKAAKVAYRKPHAMRHSYATWLLEEGADIRYVKDQLGHSSIEETEGTYAHLVPERHEPRVALLDGYLVNDAVCVTPPPAVTLLMPG